MAKSLSPKTLKTLQDAADYVGAARRNGFALEQIINTMIDVFGAKRVLAPKGNTLRCGGVTASCTWSRDKGLLDAWTRLATIRLAQEAMQ